MSGNENMAFTLRYYAPKDNGVPFRHKDRYSEVLQILKSIKSKHGINLEIFGIRSEEISGNLYVDEKHEKQIYESHFKPRAKILNKRVGSTLPKALRSRSGHYYVAGVVAIIRGGLVEWYTCYESCKNKFDRYDKNLEIGFLKAVLDIGPSLLEELCTTPINLKEKSEAGLIDKFIKTGILKGKFNLEVKVGSRISDPFDYRKSIDFICSTDTETWIIEASRKLNYEVLGEVITKSDLYGQEYPNQNLKLGILCSEIDKDIFDSCKRRGIRVFKLNDEK